MSVCSFCVVSGGRVGLGVVGVVVVGTGVVVVVLVVVVMAEQTRHSFMTS